MTIFLALGRFHDIALQLAQHISFDRRNPVDLHRMALYGSVIEFVGAIDVLLKSERRIGVPSVFRSLLEAGVELRNLLRDPAYLHHMNAAHSSEWLRVLREAKTGGNRYLSRLAGQGDLDEQIRSHEDQLAQLRANGHGPLNVLERFERADMVEEYRSLYNFLSCDSHSNIRALISRHLNMLGEDDVAVCFYKDEPLDSYLPVADSACALLLQTSDDVHKQYGSGMQQEVQSMLEELASVRKSYAA